MRSASSMPRARSAGRAAWGTRAEGLAELRQRLARFGPPASVSVAIERPSGLVVDTLMDAGHPVVPIHPNALKASRPRYSAAGSKSDPGDGLHPRRSAP